MTKANLKLFIGDEEIQPKPMPFELNVKYPIKESGDLNFTHGVFSTNEELNKGDQDGKTNGTA